MMIVLTGASSDVSFNADVLDAFPLVLAQMWKPNVTSGLDKLTTKYLPRYLDFRAIRSYTGKGPALLFAVNADHPRRVVRMDMTRTGKLLVEFYEGLTRASTEYEPQQLDSDVAIVGLLLDVLYYVLDVAPEDRVLQVEFGNAWRYPT